jgi:ankyrin repeat protein
MAEQHWRIAQIDDAINRDDFDEVSALLSSGVDPNSRDAAGDPLLITAAWIGSPRIVKLLLDAGADSSLRGVDGLTALERLMQNTQYWDEGHNEVKKLLEQVSL